MYNGVPRSDPTLCLVEHMSDETTAEFLTYVRDLRSSEPEAIDRFMLRYQPFIRRSLRFRIARASLQPAADSVDLCQSVLGSFLIRLTAGEYELRSEEDLRNLLVAIASKKFLMFARRESATKRDRRITESIQEHPELASQRIGPQTVVLMRELRQEMLLRLSNQEQELLKLREAGTTWTEIGQKLHEDSTTLRQRFSRAIRRVALQLGIEE